MLIATVSKTAVLASLSGGGSPASGLLLALRGRASGLCLFDRGLESLHQVDDLGRLFFRGSSNGDLLPLDLLLDELLEGDAVFVLELLGPEFVGELLNELPC